jgi:hypothetical protein
VIKSVVVVCAVGLLVFVELPARRANLDYVRVVSALVILNELGEPGVVSGLSVEPSARRDIALVAGRAVKVNNSAPAGLRMDQETIFSFSARTRSRCFELEPGCMEMEQKRASTSVSVKVPM